MTTIHAAIGNSDDKLTQQRWSEYAGLFVDTIRDAASQVHGVWWSTPGAPWQNCCVGFVVEGDTETAMLRRALTGLRREYDQDSIAWSITASTDMI